MNVTIQNFTNVYLEQPFMVELKNKSGVCWLDCSLINGTDCYCDSEAVEILSKMIYAENKSKIHFFDNGNYHYLSKLWLDSLNENFDLLIFDHHPDMQPPRFEGVLSCGGWVKEVLDCNRFVQNILLVGVQKKLVADILQEQGSDAFKNNVDFIFEENLDFVEKNASEFLSKNPQRPLYISIDKDVLQKKDAVTNWDQGGLTFECLAQILKMAFKNRKILGVDICGERDKNLEFAEVLKADQINNLINKKLYQLITSLM